MKVLLVGHEGYVGIGLHAYLNRNHKVTGWDKKENLFSLDAAFLAKQNFELLINLSVMADRGSPRYMVGNATDEVNVMGARHIANILKGSDIAWIQMSTREVLGPVYGPKDVIKTKAGLRPKWLVDETQPYAPRNFYGKSKLIAEFLSESHPASAIIRLTTCYTDFDRDAGSWVTQVLRSVVQGRPATLTRGGEQFRDPLHVDDLGRLMEAIVEKKAFGERFHAGGGRRNLISLKEFVRIAKPDVKIQRMPGGDYGFAFDIRKAAKLTGWAPTISIREKLPVMAAHIRRGITSPVA
jgi:nucleoside-diphosphate-sugar epimerase